jgi:NADPH2:quinone reductase
VPASDFSGTVDAVGASIDSLKPGTRVYGFVPAEDLARGKNGALATFVNVPRKFVLPAPAHLSDEELGGVTLVGLTALTLAATLRQGDRVLIVGGSTAVGLLAADVARAKGASLIVASASGAKAKFIKERGVDETIDCEWRSVQRSQLH